MDSEREQAELTRTVLVTGGTGGLGTAVTARFLHAGWRVVVPWIAPGELPRLPRHSMLELTETDLFDDQAVAACVKLAASRADAPLAAVVNLVGGFHKAGRVHETPVNRASMPDADFTRWVRPEKIAEVIHFLCSVDASAITGAHLDVPGRV